MSFGGTALSTDMQEFATTEEANEIDATACNDTSSVYLAGMIDRSATATILDATDGTANFNMLTPQASGTLIYAPQGTTAGKPKFTINSAVLLSRNRTVNYSDAVSYEVNWRLNAAPTAGTY